LVVTGDQSRLLKGGDRVCWASSATDCGTVGEVDWSGVKLVWDDGQTSSVRHNDMGAITVVPVKV
jgi:hypothetical protein